MPNHHPNSKQFFRSPQNDRYVQSQNFKTEGDNKSLNGEHEHSHEEIDQVWGHLRNKSDAMNNGKTYEKTEKHANPFVIRRPLNTVVMRKKDTHHHTNKNIADYCGKFNNPKAINFSDPWTKFCRKNLSKRAH